MHAVDFLAALLDLISRAKLDGIDGLHIAEGMLSFGVTIGRICGGQGWVLGAVLEALNRTEVQIETHARATPPKRRKRKPHSTPKKESKKT